MANNNDIKKFLDEHPDVKAKLGDNPTPVEMLDVISTLMRTNELAKEPTVLFSTQVPVSVKDRVDLVAHVSGLKKKDIVINSLTAFLDAYEKDNADKMEAAASESRGQGTK